MKKLFLLTISLLLLQSCLNNEKKTKSKDNNTINSESYGFLKNLSVMNGKLIAEIDLIDVDQNNNINNQDSEIKKFTIIDSVGSQQLKTELLNNEDGFQESNDIYVFKTNSNGDITGIAKYE